MQLRSGPRAASHACKQASRRRVVVCVAAGDKKRVVVLGGTGRVGSATAASLLENHGSEYEVALGGRSRENYEACVQRRPQLKDAPFVACDIADPASVKVRARRAQRVVGQSASSRAEFFACVACHVSPSHPSTKAATKRSWRCGAISTPCNHNHHITNRPPTQQTKTNKQSAIAGASLVVHTAGPFQRSGNFNVLEAAIGLKVPYMDVCDDTEYSKR